ncbi:complex I intermediate-associated protein 30 [Ilyonectria sp. MPI-CAGE-AT-0026]|nr:complex I intermediate-associated protein 30 [Ilyonectria sp. MPI-CAGE-AT-0026]
MRATQLLLSKGLFGRSMDELKRKTHIAMSFEAIKGAATPRPLYDFNNASAVRDCIVMSDRSIGGYSESNFEYKTSDVSSTSTSAPSPSHESSSPPPSFARFHGSISTRLPTDRPNIERTGFAGFRTPDQRPTLFGRAMWDIDPFIYLAMRVKSDGRAYFINLQTESVEPSDLHQHRLFPKRPGQWETILIKWNDFVRTNHGFVVEPQTEMLRQKVLTMGIGLTDRTEGPFELCIERVWATNDLAEVEATDLSDESELRNRKGERVRW